MFRELVIEYIKDYDWPHTEAAKEKLAKLSDADLFAKLLEFIDERVWNAGIID